MHARFQATESVKISVEEAEIPIQHYLRQPQRLVKAIANPKLMKQLSDDLYELKMRPINFMGIYHFQPTVLLKVWTRANGTVYLKSEGCQIQGIDYINRRFCLNLKGILSPQQHQNQTTLEGQADLEVKVDIPSPLMLTPKSILEGTGNGLLKSVLTRIKQRLISQLLEDYSQWAATEVKQADNNSTITDLGLT
ncbi:conserved hypothetical protein [Hyella patelloides LEGE 07179]|uniref:DUF1997 domain-containing protein n=1 Tax=Hyella patelloides LEGE 07179 TaxID=945734 RepID=A0A563VX19_9CYAN|nr:DUF1997 domain-containing protein [Hyella patelloides]VEP16002.1 conserved hypothetical protein [Hyella patelloides LEGE 07179]